MAAFSLQISRLHCLADVKNDRRAAEAAFIGNMLVAGEAA